MSSPLEIYRTWRAMQDAQIAYQDAKTTLIVIARENPGMTSLVDADGCRWKATVGYGPTPIVNVQAIAHLSDVVGPPTGALDSPDPSPD